MREFILRARKARTSPNIKLNELPREGKIDVICSTVSNALCISNDIRRDTIVHAVLEGPPMPPKTISFFGSEIRGFFSDEKSIANYIAAALQKGAYLEKNEHMKVRTGIYVAKKSFERFVWEKHNEYKKVIFLDPSGKDIRKADIGNDFVAVFGSAEGLPPKTAKLLKDTKAEKISLGPKMLFASNCPVIIHNEVDRRMKK